jgi:nitrite reductase (NADH) small subunit
MNDKQWTTICSDEDLTPDAGLCALFYEDQVAIFRFSNHDRLYAVSNYDPIGDANVMSRGIIGSVGGQHVVASPLYKQHYCLETGECIEEDARLKTYAVRSHLGEIQLSMGR